jgi:hypothetical protein
MGYLINGSDLDPRYVCDSLTAFMTSSYIGDIIDLVCGSIFMIYLPFISTYTIYTVCSRLWQLSGAVESVRLLPVL